MLTILKSRDEARKLAAQIHEWRQKNIEGYNATSWANENLPDAEYDLLTKSEKAEQWQVPDPHDVETQTDLKTMVASKGQRISKLPVDWKPIAVVGEVVESVDQSKVEEQL